jgi:hypothetical protein
MTIFQQVFVGAVAGAGFAFAGAAKNVSQNKESFDVNKLFDAVLTGAVVGGLGGLLGAEQSSVEELGAAIVMYGGATQLLKHLFKAIVAFTKPHIEHLKRLLTRK